MPYSEEGGRCEEKQDTWRKNQSQNACTVYRRREGVGADLELKLIRLSLNVPWVPCGGSLYTGLINVLSCHVGAAGAKVFFSLP